MLAAEQRAIGQVAGDQGLGAVHGGNEIEGACLQCLAIVDGQVCQPVEGQAAQGSAGFLFENQVEGKFARAVTRDLQVLRQRFVHLRG
ncbi:hypothetical protein D3C78_819680 [compost metagenome]